MPPLRKVTTGQPLNIPASDYNAFVDCARDYQQNSQRTARNSNPENLPAGQVYIRNDSGVDCSRFDILGVDGMVFTPDTSPDARNRLVLSCSLPSVDYHSGGRFAVLARPAAAGKVAAAYVSGICLVKVDITDQSHLYADIIDAEKANLTSCGNGGVSIISRQAGTGVLWAVIRCGSPAGSDIRVFRLTDVSASPMKGLQQRFASGSFFDLTGAVEVDIWPHSYHSYGEYSTVRRIWAMNTGSGWTAERPKANIPYIERC